MKPQFDMLAAYNEWANRRLYDAAAGLPDEDYRADRGAFFGSLHGTLNHLLVGDRIWMRRFTGEGDQPARLDAIVHDDFHALRAARRAEDARITAYVTGLSEAGLDAVVRYRTTRNPTDIEHCLLTGLMGEAPSFDLLVFQRQTGIGLTRGRGGSFSEPERRP